MTNLKVLNVLMKSVIPTAILKINHYKLRGVIVPHSFPVP